jgi:hypothetical protein
MLSTMVCILAVDFPIFDRKFSKNNQYGVSLMDTGVGAFIALNGILSSEARSPFSNDQFLLKKSMTSSIPLLVIGVARMIALRITNYNYNISEYGVHWNFFVTVALVKCVCAYLHCKIRRSFIHPVVFAGAVMVGYQTILCYGLGDYLLDDESRGNILSANKEGLCSIIGFIPLYMMSVCFGKHLHSERRRGKSVDFILIAIEAGLLSVVTGAASFLCNCFFQEVSRRQSNAAYILWIMCLYCLLLSVESLLCLAIEFMESTGLLRSSESSRSILSSSFESNSLVIFLLANLLTGFINLSSNTMEAGVLQSLSILIIYTLLLSQVSFYLKRNKIVLRFSENDLQVVYQRLRVIVSNLNNK